MLCIIEILCRSGIHTGLHALLDQCARDDLDCVGNWLGIIEQLLSDILKNIRVEVVKLIPMMLDIAEVSETMFSVCAMPLSRVTNLAMFLVLPVVSSTEHAVGNI